jgi:hypothetical protein
MEAAHTLELDDNVALVEQEERISEYELERGKPMPNEIHSFAQSNLHAAFVLRYKKQFTVFSELTIEVGEARATPDIVIPALCTELGKTCSRRKSRTAACGY